VIVVATISSVLAEKLLGPYGEDGTALPADVETGMPFTDYLVQIESVLKADDVVAGADTLVLRMWGYLSRQGQGPAGGPIFAGLSNEMPKPGDHLLFFLGRNPDGTYGTGPWGLLNIDGETVAYADGMSFPFEMAPAQFMDEIRDAVSRISSHKGTVASLSASKLVLVVDGDELTFDITGAKIYREGGDLAQDAEVKIEAEDSPDGLVAIRVNVVKGSVEEDLRKKVEEAEAREALLAAFLAWNRKDSEAFRSSFTDQGILGTVLSLPESIGDSPIGLLRVMYAEVYRDTVSVHVMFDLGVQRNSLEYSLVKTEEGWKIDGEQTLFLEIKGGAATVDIRLDECSFESGSNTLATGNVALSVVNVGQRARHLAFVKVPESLDTIQVIDGRISVADVLEALAYVHDL
jgi:hypothetical protein